jgi:phenylpropionate dioxygenase-like ring-hydroxylating dioxygenase large terminal subunit
MRRTSSSARDLVDTAVGEISREIFVNEDIYAEEKVRVFSRAWLYIGHESQIRNRGDYFVSKMGE